MKKTICELFAGVGGFRLGFERLNSGWKTVYFNQYEPSRKNQSAYECYIYHFGQVDNKYGRSTSNLDINLVNKDKIPNHTLLVAGFPCQDYSVAQTLSKSKGIQGKKGVLWWQIYQVLLSKSPSFCLFENVDRLLKSPAKQRGRDFGIILSCLHLLGYDVEWRVINSASYSSPQRRKRIFIFAFKRKTWFARYLLSKKIKGIFKNLGFFSRAFPIHSPKKDNLIKIEIKKNPRQISKSFKNTFYLAGYMRDGKVYTIPIEEKIENLQTLGSILEPESQDKYYLTKDKIERFRFLKGAKKIQRTSSSGYNYTFSEGKMRFPDALNKPSRTILTNESSISRTSHVIKDPKTKKKRVLTPLEVERLQGFDDNWTNTGMTERFRYFCMGNALVVPLITKMGKVLDKIIVQENNYK